MLMLYNTACPALNGYCGETHLGNKLQLCLSHMESKSVVSKVKSLLRTVKRCDMLCGVVSGPLDSHRLKSGSVSKRLK